MHAQEREIKRGGEQESALTSYHLPLGTYFLLRGWVQARENGGRSSEIRRTRRASTVSRYRTEQEATLGGREW